MADERRIRARGVVYAIAAAGLFGANTTMCTSTTNTTDMGTPQTIHRGSRTAIRTGTRPCGTRTPTTPTFTTGAITSRSVAHFFAAGKPASSKSV